jgi:hypothetical protein
MKSRIFVWLVALAWLAIIVAPALAAEAITNAPPASPPGVPDLPRGNDGIWLALIPPITFTITWLMGKIPPLPKVILPWITPVVGIAIGWVFDYATKANLPWWSAAGAGAIATTIYEAAKGLTKAGPESKLTPTEGKNDPPNT